MMIHDVTKGLPRNKPTKRKGRGESSGHGKTSGRGNKGSKARSGTYIKRGYEGGQTPIFKRFPKRGFSNQNFERRFHIVNIADLIEQFEDGAIVDATVLKDKGLIPDNKQPVKILGEGAVTKKLTINAGWYSKAAHQKIVDAGGTALTTKGEVFAFPKPKKKFIVREAVKKVKPTEEAAAADAGGEKKGAAKAPEAKAESAPAAE